MKILKPFVFAGSLAVILSSCLNDRDGDKSMYGNFAVTDVEIPEVINQVGKSTDIKVSFQTTNTCQSFVDFQGGFEGDTQTTLLIAVVGRQTAGAACTETDVVKSEKLIFTPTVAGEYTLKFWSGTSTEGDTQTPTYITKVINVPETATEGTPASN